VRVGVCIFNANYSDWDRFEAEEADQGVPGSPSVPDHQVFREDLGFAIEAERLGYDTIWTIEHHFTPYGMETNPLQYLTYIAGVTKRVDVGSMVVVLPWHNPVRVAEDVNMLQLFLGENRRVIAGVGRGLARREFQGLGIDQNESRSRFNESLLIVRDLLRDGRITFHGEHFDLDNVRLRPQPERDLSDQLWCAAGSPETLEIQAKYNVSPLIIPNTDLDTALQGVQHYMGLRGQYGFGPTNTKLSIYIYVAETEEEAREGIGYLRNYGMSVVRHYELLANYHKDLKGYERYASIGAALQGQAEPYMSIFEGQPWGTPEKVLEQISVLGEKFGASEIMGVFRFGGMPLDKAQKNLRLFAEKVLPGLHAQNFEPLPVAVAAS